MSVEAPSVSVIIPVLNDTRHLVRTLESVGRDRRVEVIVVEAGVTDAQMTALRQQNPHVQWLRSSPGRGRQMNAGASHARGEWLLFLHADTQLPAGWIEEVESAGRDPKVVGGSFRLRIDARGFTARLIERGVAARVRLFDLPYGDQALFVRREVFESLGGYRELPLMEDVDFVRRLNRAGRKLHSSLPVLTSARRWERNGWLRSTAENILIIILYFLGVSPHRLARIYRSHRIAVAVMARAPSDDRGKTRLLAELAAENGADLRRAIFLDTLDAVAEAAIGDLVVLFTPDTAESELRTLADHVLLPQRGDDLGERLEHGFADLLAHYSGVLIIGSDVPTLPVPYLKRAASALQAADADIVLGPALDGGYYLIGLRQPHPELFRNVPWSTSGALAVTAGIAREAGLSVTLLPQWYDVDSISDLRRVAEPLSEGAHRARHTEEWVKAHP